MALGQVLAVFIGGGAGATCRYLVGHALGGRYGGDFPLGTFLINASGCFALGLLASLVAASSVDATLLLALLGTGLLGGYTTFSTYALEGVLLYREGRHRLALVNLFGSVASGMLAAAGGASVARLIVGA